MNPRPTDDEPIDNGRIRWDRTISLGNIIAIIVFICGMAMQWAIINQTIAQHEFRLTQLEAELKASERELIKRAVIQDMNVKAVEEISAKLDRIEGYMRQHLENDRQNPR